MVDFGDFEQFVAQRRIIGLVANPDGSRLIVTCQEPDRDGARYVSALWDVDPAGEREATRLTWSDKGETGPAFLPDGSVVFSSARPHPDQVEDESALWVLPVVGEPIVYATSPGGLSSPVVAARSGTVVASGSRLPESTSATEDRSRRDDRRKRKLGALVHDGFPIRHWDRELGEEFPRLFAVTGDRPEPDDLIPQAREHLVNASIALSADGAVLATTWRVRLRGGAVPTGLAVLDLDSGKLRVLGGDAHTDCTGPALSPDGANVAVIYTTDGDFDHPMTYHVRVFGVRDDAVHDIDTGDLYPTELAWSLDSASLVIAGDLHGSGALATWRPGERRPTIVLEDAVYSSLSPAPNGVVYALRTAVDVPPQPVRITLGAAGAGVTTLRSPAPPPALPGHLERIVAQASDGATVGGWLCVPNSASAQALAPVQLWIHGGPFGSTNSWSWRWCPWVAVARGYAVVLPDPALSTGYGPDWIARAWPHRAAPVWRDLQAVLDLALTRPEVDGDHVACLGGSFGGYMTNWIAGHTERFAAIVTHAGLWALDQQHTTTDAANWKSHLFGTPADHPEWYAENSPHNFVDGIVTPMLVVHGNRDYRVPVSEALRLWWDLVSRFDGDPADLPHRFLQFTGENHWILSPGNAVVWWQTVQGFVDEHVRNSRPSPE